MTAKLAEGEGVEPLPFPVAPGSSRIAHHWAPPSVGTGLLPRFGRVFLMSCGHHLGQSSQTLDAPCLVVPWGVEPPSVDYESTASTTNASGQFGAGRGNRTLLCPAWKAGGKPAACPLCVGLSPPVRRRPSRRQHPTALVSPIRSRATHGQSLHGCAGCRCFSVHHTTG